MSNKLTLSSFPFHHNVQTRWKDIDSFGHINNALYLTYIEDSRIKLLHRWDLIDKNNSIIVASIKIDYINQVTHPSEIIVGSKILRIGNSSFDISSALFINNTTKIAAKSIATCVCYDYTKNQSIEVYSSIKNDFKI